MAALPENVRTIVERFRLAISSEFDVRKFILFGSYASGRYTEDSDIDICVIASGIENNAIALWNIARKIEFTVPTIEPVVFSLEDYEEEPSFGLLREIKEKGVEL